MDGQEAQLVLARTLVYPVNFILIPIFMEGAGTMRRGEGKDTPKTVTSAAPVNT